ncbi:MAG: oligosaccharide flippase family protein [Candidatus Nanopelagicales bacterium]
MSTSETTRGSTRAAMQSPTVRGAAYVAIGLGVGQALAYLLSLAAARSLGPEDYGIFGSMLAIMLVGSVLALGIQAAGAKRIVLDPVATRSTVGLGVLHFALWSGIAVAAATALVSPLISSLLHLDGLVTVLLVAANLAPITWMGGLLGVSQGRERNARLALSYAIMGVGRAIGGIAAVILTKSIVTTLTAMAIGTFIAFGICWLLASPLVAKPPKRLAGFRIDVVHATHALFALFVLTNLDVLLARHYLPATQAGMYAAGAVVTKIAFWLPQFVAMVAYPRLADHRRAETLTKGAAAVIGIGVIATGFVALFPSFVVTFIGGSAYEELVSEVWIFAAIGSAFGLAQFLLYGQIAASKRAAIAALWVAAATLVVLVSIFHSSVLQIAVIVLLIASMLAIVGVIELLFERRSEAKEIARVG